MPHWGRIKTAHARQPSTGERYGRREQTGQPHKQQQQQQRQEQEEKETGSSVMITERGQQQKKNCSRFAKRK